MVNLALVSPAAVSAIEADFRVSISWPADQCRCPDEQVGVYDGTRHLGDLHATSNRDDLGARFTEPKLRAGVAGLTTTRGDGLRARLAQRDLETAPAADVDRAAFSRRLWQKMDGDQ